MYESNASTYTLSTHSALHYGLKQLEDGTSNLMLSHEFGSERAKSERSGAREPIKQEKASSGKQAKQFYVRVNKQMDKQLLASGPLLTSRFHNHRNHGALGQTTLTLSPSICLRGGRASFTVDQLVWHFHSSNGKREQMILLLFVARPVSLIVLRASSKRAS